jgi:transposase-like protein
MEETTTTQAPSPLLGAEWSDPIEDGMRGRVRAFIEAILEEELEAALGRGRYERAEGGSRGWRNGHRVRQVIGTFGPETVRVPRARLAREDGGTAEWRSKGLRRYQRLTKRAEALIAGAYLAGTNTRRVRRALAALFEGAIGKDVVSRAWRKVKTDWEAWNARDLGGEDVVRLILDGTVVRARVDRKATAISLLVAVGVRRDGQKILLALKAMGGESAAAWTAFLEDMTRRGLRAPEFVTACGAPGLDAALSALWPDAPVQRCSVHKHRNPGSSPGQALLAHAPKRLHDELTEAWRDMIYAETAADVQARRKAFLRKWRLKCRAVADSLEGEGGPWPRCGRVSPPNGDRLFTPDRVRGRLFTRLPPGQWKSARTTNAIERLHEEFRRRIKTQTVLPEAETAPMLFWALLASGQIVMRKIDGWDTLAVPLADQAIDLAA